MADVDAILSKLEGVKRSGAGWLARCPAHEDGSPSLSISERDGTILLHCHAGCEPLAVLDSIGVEFGALFPDSSLQSKPQRRIISAVTALEILEFEALFLRVVCADIERGKLPDAKTIKRVREAHNAILDAYRLTK